MNYIYSRTFTVEMLYSRHLSIVDTISKNQFQGKILYITQDSQIKHQSKIIQERKWRWLNQWYSGSKVAQFCLFEDIFYSQNLISFIFKPNLYPKPKFHQFSGNFKTFGSLRPCDQFHQIYSQNSTRYTAQVFLQNWITIETIPSHQIISTKCNRCFPKIG